ncbi:AbrB/MazE/SpoVT family DNA-binding domain-containing protein [Bacillus wiedmannii]|uniref:AbrB/MazE/SpoVT family DNA-binding domain-containing protein n=1 Tax=Bacillus wiedmannii TaxID=1890302 RepID=UPI002E1DC756|nr:AbrB/MazE/SpoVT family DNA-binding domain-containing protein [Bacillus wiedmannii]
MDDLGRFVIPRETRRTLNIHRKDPLGIFVEGETIVLQKYKSCGTCPITGEISSKNIKLADGKLTLSLEGAKQLLEELEQYLERA